MPSKRPLEAAQVQANEKTTHGVERLQGEVAGVSSAFNKGLVQAGEPVENPEMLDERLTACLEQLRRDFDRGIVLVDDETTTEQYAAALEADKTAGQKWETLEDRLRANGAGLLKKAAAMPEGPCLIGIYPDGTLAIRQRSREIVNARWTKEWEDGDSENEKGELLLLLPAEALARPEGRWANPGEIVRAVREAGYLVPADPQSYEKKGLVAASDAVMGGNYVESPVTRNPQDRKWCAAMLECPENLPDSADVRMVDFNPYRQKADVLRDIAYHRSGNRGAILWLRG